MRYRGQRAKGAFLKADAIHLDFLHAPSLLAGHEAEPEFWSQENAFLRRRDEYGRFDFGFPLDAVIGPDYAKSLEAVMFPTLRSKRY